MRHLDQSNRLRRPGALAAAAALCATLLLAGAAEASGPPTDLTVGDRTRPLNVEGAPQFGWIVGDGIQRAYQIEVTRVRGHAVVWNSGRVESGDQSYVAYAGPALDHGAAYEWTVRTWDAAGRASAWARRGRGSTRASRTMTGPARAGSGA